MKTEKKVVEIKCDICGKDLKNEVGLMYFNFFNYIDLEVPYEIVIANEKTDKMDKGYMVDPNNIVLKLENKIDTKSSVIGLMISYNDSMKSFFLTNDKVAGGNVSAPTERGNKVRKYMTNHYQSMLTLDSLLIDMDNVNIISEYTDEITEEDVDMDLSPENIDKTTFIDLFS